MVVKVEDWGISEYWTVLIPTAKGRGEEVFQKVPEQLKKLKVPEIEVRESNIGSGVISRALGKTRRFIKVTHTRLKGFIMYIGAIDYGTQLFVSWYLKQDKEGTKPDFLDLEDLTAYVSTVHSVVKDTVKEISESVAFDFSKVDQKSRGFLNIS